MRYFFASALLLIGGCSQPTENSLNADFCEIASGTVELPKEEVLLSGAILGDGLHGFTLVQKNCAPIDLDLLHEFETHARVVNEPDAGPSKVKVFTFKGKLRKYHKSDTDPEVIILDVFGPDDIVSIDTASEIDMIPDWAYPPEDLLNSLAKDRQK
tara:strand:+ start:1024 stop:1491 length:468 start_codon:yes stop_codon:yes gene_type:complete